MKTTTFACLRTSFRGGALVLAGCLGVHLLAAQATAQRSATPPRAGRAAPAEVAPRQASVPPQVTSTPARQAIDAVYQSASAATTVGQLEDAMQRCAELRKVQLPAQDAAYLNQLEAWLLNRRGEAYATAAGRAMGQHQDAEAIRLEQMAVADFSASGELERHWRAFHNRGVSLAMLGKYDEAIADFGVAIELNPDYPNTLFNRAELWLELGRYEAAETDYSEVLQRVPNDFDALMGRGHARFYLTRFDEALADFDAAIEQDGEQAVAFADRADLYAFTGNWEAAAQDYRMAIQLDRGLGRAYQSAAWLMATCPDDRFRDADLALRSAQRAVELDGTSDYRYLDTLAAAQANAKRFGEAVQSVEQAVQIAPPEVRGELQQRLALYEAQRPFRDQIR